ncbi:LOG family protein [Microbacterium karelineae]|uniref:LOG family protein n=1 Tax=Microbacterium karelineae TaxID=2654283 RepID=UPI0012E9DDB5|nr:Rossmann fold nucleotide-binding protein [Microbacterium karelineae]
MKHTRGRVTTIESLTELDRRLDAGATRLHGWRIVGLDLRDRTESLAACDTSRTTFAGCALSVDDAHLHAMRGALVLPTIDAAPVDPHRRTLYAPDELFDGPDWSSSLDGRAYAWQQTADDRDALLARTLHDDGVDTALRAWVARRGLVGVMGGHALQRDEDGFRDAAHLGRALGAFATVATGGGPGAMEAANLGARLADRGEDELEGALDELALTPSFHPSIDAWAAAARAVTDLVPDPVDSLGVPTWHYGHEPPNLFATAIAKYFRNALREAVLLEICDRGIVFLPGAGGTVQEVFQDACENYYATDEAIAPMVLVGRSYWTDTLPVWPLLTALAEGRGMESRVHLVDSVDEAAAVIAAG